MTDTHEKSAFDKKVDECRKDEKSDLIDNAAINHALYLFQNLFEVAAENEEKVRLVSGTLNNDFYSELTNKLEACIDKGVDVEVMLLNGDAEMEGNSFLDKVKEYAKGRVLTAKRGKNVPGAHMLLIGDEAKRFRLELDHEQTKAIASFNNPSMGEALNVIYDSLRESLDSSNSSAAA